MMLTSGDRPGDISRCEQLGVSAYLLKPVKRSELFDAVLLALGETVADDTEPASPTDDRTARDLRPLEILLAEDSLVNQKLAVTLGQPRELFTKRWRRWEVRKTTTTNRSS